MRVGGEGKERGGEGESAAIIGIAPSMGVDRPFPEGTARTHTLTHTHTLSLSLSSPGSQ